MQFSCAVILFLLCVKLRSDIKYNSDQASEIMFKSTMTVHISISTRFINRSCVFITLYFFKPIYFITHYVYNKQLLDEAEHDIKNYSDRGQCYLPKRS